MNKIEKENTLWERLKKESRPIVLYGTGNGGDKILDACINKGISVSGVFASAGFVRDRYFRGMKVKSLEQLEDELGCELCVLLCFGATLESVCENIKAVSEKHTLYAPDVPLYGGELWDWEKYDRCFPELCETEKLFADERSKKLFSDIISFRMTGELKYLADAENPGVSYKELFGGESVDTVIDCGAYRGDSASQIAEALSPRAIYAVEPDPRTFAKLSAYAENETRCTVVPVHAAVGDENTKTRIAASAGRGSGILGTTKGAKAEAVPLRTVTCIAEENGIGGGDGSRLDLIKYDVEGVEKEALAGSFDIIKKESPCLAVSVYHRTDDIYELPRYVSEMCQHHKLYLRRAPCIPAWDTVLFACRDNAGQRAEE